jgi:hypothetical protein
MTTKSKRSLIFESVATIRIDVHPALNNKARHDDIYMYYMHRGLPCSKKKMLESVTLHKVVPQVPLQRPPSLAESFLRRV